MTASFERKRAWQPPGVLGLAPGWILLGLAGSMLLTLAATRLIGGTVSWWFHPRIIPGPDLHRAEFYAGMTALAVAWLGLGRVARNGSTSPAQISLVAALWCTPLVVGVPLFSRDLYSYIAQGAIAHLGLSPYHDAPAVLAHLGHRHVMDAVDPFWRRATAPYGPLFLAVISRIVGFTGSNLVLGAVLVRGFDLVGLVLLAIFVPRIARRTGADPTRAVWLAIASPLVLLQLVAPGHNDLLMAGIMVAGVALALERGPLLGIVVCTLAATIKLPAIAAVVFVAAAWIRSEERPIARVTVVAKVAVAAIATVAAVTALTGFGLGWISTTLFSTPARVRLAITPATDISWTIAKLLGGATATFKDIESVLRPVGFVASLLIGLAMLRRSRGVAVPHYLGLALVALAFGGPALWPWYLSWGLVLLAASPRAQNWRALVAGILAGSFLVKPAGILLLPLASSPIVVAAWVALALLGWRGWRIRERSERTGELAESLGRSRSVLAER